MNALAAQEEIDLSRTVRSVFGDDSSLSCVDVLIVEQDGILGKRKDRPVSGGVLLQSVRALPPLRGLLHVMKQISDFVINIPDTIDLAAREGWARVVRAHGEALPCSLDAMDDAAARGHLEVVKWLHEHHPEWNTRYGLADAVVNGHPEVVDWLIEYGRDWDFNWKHYERFDCSEIMLKHLEEKRKSYPITCPIVEAAAAGWLDEIERLHCNVSAYKIKFAMAEAARHNQVEVITYLIKRYGRMDVLRYLGSYGVYKEGEHERQLYDRVKELCRASDALGEAARAGQREVVRWILDEENLAMYRSYVDSSIFVIERAVRDNQHDVVELVCSCCSKDEVYSTLHRGVSLRCGLDAIKAIYNACPPEKLAGAAKELLAKFNPCDEETVKFLRSVEHI
ncbi:hypothetical protein PC129_g7042 [Phytophthora cactorum]|uniref:Ankyrin repeat-containing domain n=1 Tax=Phytophthora cactorum TaxID=29920 RepID=A0A329SCG8_9STRA|nr:hypothetical protein PC112_g5643 [Phytophthora cactorum]KAG2911027.1 hypothetical protein PC114_g9547 [Phytophthora cactorum]KAG2926342.1 hypothetical protein PC115_g7908 [Phytophthora cactorum]KAG2943502.1 hypothetical protein PC117_g9431 [Phytophthora cactorum]KAG3088045.1 hypothetical protein PC122_g8555 [Phytophthora cactorum]